MTTNGCFKYANLNILTKCYESKITQSLLIFLIYENYIIQEKSIPEVFRASALQYLRRVNLGLSLTELLSHSPFSAVRESPIKQAGRLATRPDREIGKRGGASVSPLPTSCCSRPGSPGFSSAVAHCLGAGCLPWSETWRPRLLPERVCSSGRPHFLRQRERRPDNRAPHPKATGAPQHPKPKRKPLPKAKVVAPWTLLVLDSAGPYSESFPPPNFEILFLL